MHPHRNILTAVNGMRVAIVIAIWSASLYVGMMMLNILLIFLLINWTFQMNKNFSSSTSFKMGSKT